MENIFANSQQYIDLVTEYSITYSLQILAALAVFLIGKRIARIIANTVKKTLERKEVDYELIAFIDSLLYSLLFIVVCIAALTQLGIQTASFIALLGAAGLAIGLALQGSLSNFAAGILIIILRPFKSGDFVDTAGEAGVVQNIKIFTTELRTGDNKCVIIPNARVLNSNIVNHSSTGRRRVDLVFSVAYEDDLDHARNTILRVLSEDDRILKDPETIVAVSALSDSSVDFIVRPWVKSEDYWPVNRSLLEQMKKRFDKEGITIPFPQRTMHLIK